jgi:hypothetical protein
MVKQKTLEKRKTRKRWHTTRSPQDKANLNKPVKELKQLLNDEKQKVIQTYLESLTATEGTEYSLWKATKRLKWPQTLNPPLRTDKREWANSDTQKANVLAEHFANVFKPYNSEMTKEEEKEILHALETPGQLETPVKKFKLAEVRSAINQLPPKKAPGYDLITGRVLKELPDIGIRTITHIFNSVLRTGYFPGQWKVSQIIPILKPGKPADEAKSYSSISLLPIISKLFEKFFLKGLTPILQVKRIIPDRQFGFRQKHPTVEQVHLITNVINVALGNDKYCTAAFLDISQAFGKVWHEGLLYKIKTIVPDIISKILKSYLENRYFLLK